MKKVLFIRTAVLSALLFSYASSFSQSMDTERLASVKLNTHSLSEATAANAAASTDEITLMDMRKKNVKMFNHFTTDFPDASNIRLHANKENETLISCMVNGDLTKVDYSKNGKLLSSVRYFEAKKLADWVTNLVLDAYPRYSIFGFVAEAHVAGKIAYFVMIEKGNSWKRVRVIDENVDTYEEYQNR